MYCKRCGAYLPEDTGVCNVCGLVMDAAPPPPETAQTGGGQAAQTPAQPEPAPAPPPAEQTAPPAGAQGPAPARPIYQQAAWRQSAPPPARPGAPVYGPGAGGYGAAPAPQPRYPAQPGGYCPPQGQEPVSETIKTGEWLWSTLAAAVPFVGFILLLVWAFGGGAKPSKRNWARANLIFYGVLAAGYALLFLIGIAAAAGSYGYYY